MSNYITLMLSYTSVDKGFFVKVYPRQFPADDNTFLEVLKIFIPLAKAKQINKLYEESLIGGMRRRTKLRRKKRRRTKKVKRSKSKSGGRKKYRSKRRKSRSRSRSRRRSRR